MSKLKPLTAALIVGGVLVSTAGAFSLPGWMKTDEKVATASTAPAPGAMAAAAVVPAAPIPPAQAPNYRAIVEATGPAVVGVTVEGTQKRSEMAGDESAGLPPGMEDDPFFRFFKGIPGFGQRGGRRGAPDSGVPFRGLGSGFIIDSNGIILTNAHVVRGAKDVTVKLSDRREFPAKVLGSDQTTDIAVLKIDAKDLPVVRLGNPKELQVGDPVLAIGSPFGLEQSATQGIVSAKGRSLPGDAVVPFIQTDAAVNPGNSGGPLIDGSGSVVGINAQIYSQTGGYMGLSFAIPIDVALKVTDQIVKTGHADHARLGVTVQELNMALAQSFGLQRPDGALVAGVSPKSAAAAAGLKSGDVITEVNGQPINRSGELSTVIGMSAPGETVKLKVWRDKSWHEMQAKLGTAEEPGKQLANAGGAASGGQLGLALRPLSPEERQEAKLEGGLVVENASGAAARAGVEPGDVLLAINGKPVTSVEQVKSVLQSKPKSVALLVQREGEKIFVPVNLG
jgi:serine protease Do